jgi:cytoskeletal protein CcmA (bactofilin family)
LWPAHGARVRGLEALPALWPAIPEGIAPAVKRLLAFFGLADGDSVVGTSNGLDAPTTIGAGLTIKGELRGEGAVTVLGQFEGDIVLDGTLLVGAAARVDANITADAIVIAGMVRGNLSADTRVEILPTGTLTGTVKSGSFEAADGAHVKGEVWIEQSALATGTPVRR